MDVTCFQIVLGIFTGIVTSALLFLMKRWWTNWVIPFLDERRYKGVLVAGSWAGADWDDSQRSEYSFQLKQSAHHITGNARLAFKSRFNNFDLLFLVTGEIWEGYLALHLKPADRQVTSYATVLLKIGGGGAWLGGQVLYRNVNAELVSSHLLELVRGGVKEATQARDEVKLQQAETAAAEEAANSDDSEKS